MRQFVLEQKASDNLLTPLADLSQAFQQSVPSGQQLLTAEHTIGMADPETLLRLRRPS